MILCSKWTAILSTCGHYDFVEGLWIQINLDNDDNSMTWWLVTFVSGEKVHTFIAIGKLSKLLDWTCVAITPLYNGFFLSFFSRPPFFFSGMSESEQALKGTSQIKILSSEDIDGMRVVCRVRAFWFLLQSALILEKSIVIYQFVTAHLRVQTFKPLLSTEK